MDRAVLLGDVVRAYSDSVLVVCGFISGVE